MSGDGIFFLLRSIYWEILYIHRCILQDLVADVWDRSFYIHTGTSLHQILCWVHRKQGEVCFCTCTDTMLCLILCEVHSLRAACLLCRHIDRFLHPALCLVHKYGIHQMCLEIQQRSYTSIRILFHPIPIFLSAEMIENSYLSRCLENKHKSEDRQHYVIPLIKKKFI